MRGPGLGGEADLGGTERRSGGEHLATAGERRRLPRHVLPRPKLRLRQPHPAASMHAGRAVHRPLHRHDGVGTGGNRRPGHDPGTGAGPDLEARHVTGREVHGDVELHDLARNREIGRPHREAVHHRAIPRRRVAVGDDAGGEAAADGIHEPLPPRWQRLRRAFHQRDRFGEVDHPATGATARNARNRS